jgi:hypothetical protein
MSSVGIPFAGHDAVGQAKKQGIPQNSSSLPKNAEGSRFWPRPGAACHLARSGACTGPGCRQGSWSSPIAPRPSPGKFRTCPYPLGAHPRTPRPLPSRPARHPSGHPPGHPRRPCRQPPPSLRQRPPCPTSAKAARCIHPGISPCPHRQILRGKKRAKTSGMSPVPASGRSSMPAFPQCLPHLLACPSSSLPCPSLDLRTPLRIPFLPPRQ